MVTRDQRSGFRGQGGVGATSEAVTLSGASAKGARTMGAPSLARFCFCAKGGRARTLISRLSALTSLSALLLIAGCRQDMQDQPKLIPQRGSNLFADHRGARPQVVNTVARGQLNEDSYFYTGVTQAANGYREEHDELPF